MQYTFRHALPQEDTIDLISLALELTYSKRGMNLYKVLTFGLPLIVGIGAGAYFYEPGEYALLFVIGALVFCMSHLDYFYRRFLAPFFDRKYSNTQRMHDFTAEWELHFDDDGIVYQNGPSTFRLEWSGVKNIIDHPKSIILYSVGGPKFIPKQCFESQEQREAFVAFLRLNVPEGTTIDAVSL